MKQLIIKLKILYFLIGDAIRVWNHEVRKKDLDDDLMDPRSRYGKQSGCRLFLLLI